MTDNNQTDWIDISVPLSTGMVHWPGDPGVNIRRIAAIGQGHTANLSEIVMGTHTATHVDAPLHFLDSEAGTDTMPPETLVGRARVIEIRDTEAVTIEELNQYDIRRGERILLKTRNSAYAWQRSSFVEDFVYISDEAAGYLVARQIRAVGIDYLSVGSYRHGGSNVHRTLLGGGVWILEGLDLSAVTAGDYYLACLPLKIVGGDGAPARAILRRLTRSDL